ncbi:hypothetical protein FRC08_003263 [Ceratobasidium sp. 394]|nr:hypothetical protein FRC08_003263 [Ceratobasidium sp. 394]
MAYNPAASDSSFGVNVIVCGDPHQFPPVQGGASSALYRPNRPSNPPEVTLGREIYEKVDKVALLRQQVRATDQDWRTFLTNLRNGQVQSHDISMIKGWALTNPACKATDFTTKTRQDVSLVTPRHVVRNQWNDAAVGRHCREPGSQLMICPVSDTIRKRLLSMPEQYVVAQADPAEKRGGPPGTVTLAVGMSVIILDVETDLDVANGTQGMIVDVVLDPEEPPFAATASVVTLKRLPLYILVKLARHTHAITLPHLEAGVVPIVLVSKNYKITMGVQKGGQVTRSQRTVRRLHFPIIPAYAFKST